MGLAHHLAVALTVLLVVLRSSLDDWGLKTLEKFENMKVWLVEF